nr:hypothetical protein [Sorangium cellulosum]
MNDVERMRSDGVEPNVLDVLDISFIRPNPHGWQQENHIIDGSVRWAYKGKGDWSHAIGCVDGPVGPLWWNGDSSYNGLNDRVPALRASLSTRSLYLLRTSDLVLHRGLEGPPDRQKIAVRAHFTFGGEEYRIKVTDPVVADELDTDGEFPFSDAVLCVSLAEPFGGYAYKLVAAVITASRANGGPL